MKRKLFTLLLMLSMLAIVAWSPPPAACFGCSAEQKMQCFNEADLVSTYCMIVRGDPIYCTDVAAEYEDRCLAEKGCPLKPRIP